jgi:hypothetical protein
MENANLYSKYAEEKKQSLKAAVVKGRVRPFRLKIFFAYKRNKADLDPFHMCFTISL